MLKKGEYFYVSKGQQTKSRLKCKNKSFLNQSKTKLTKLRVKKSLKNKNYFNLKFRRAGKRYKKSQNSIRKIQDSIRKINLKKKKSERRRTTARIRNVQLMSPLNLGGMSGIKTPKPKLKCGKILFQSSKGKD